MKRLVKSHSQHFLRSPRLVAQLIGHTSIHRRDTVYDLGAGSGVISAALSRRCTSVVAVENEPLALKKLQHNMEDLKNVQVIKADIMRVKLPETPYKIFANIPFHLSSQLVYRLTTDAHAPAAMWLIVQKQFAQKIVPSDQRFTSALGAQLAPWWSSCIRYRLRKTDFTPPPAVDTVLIELKQREVPLLPATQRARYESFVADCYASPRAFRSLPFARYDISPEKKPSELQPEEWIALFGSDVS